MRRAGRKTDRWRIALATVSVALLGWSGQAQGQEAGASGVDATNAATNAVASSSFDRGRNVSVRQRQHPEYQAMGVDAGGFMVYPRVNMGAAYDDNIFAVTHDPLGDETFTVAPEIDFNSKWSRDALAGYIKLQQDWNASRTSENELQFGGGLEGRVDFGDSHLNLGADTGQFALPRTAANVEGFSVHKINFDLTDANAELVHEFTRIRVSARIDFQDLDFQNGVDSNGGVVFEKDQNHHTFTFSGKGELAVTPDIATYITVVGNTRDYSLQPPTVAYTRNSHGYEFDVGANFDLTHLVRGEIQLGYLQQDYDSPLFRSISGLSAKARVEWFVTQLTTVSVQGSRSVADAGVIGSAGFITSNVNLRADHELLRNLILSANGFYGRDQYNGIDRTDNHYGGGVSADWLMTRRVSMTFSYAYVDQNSDGLGKGVSFADNRVVIGTRLSF